MAIKYVKPDLSLISEIAINMRQADINEVYASNRFSPKEALMDGFNRSDYCAIITNDGVPFAMLGLAIPNILNDVGIPWMLGSNEAVKNRREFMRAAPAILNGMLDRCGYLYNYVHSENIVSKAWLKRIGFTIDDPEPYGINGELFHKFYLERGAKCVA